MVRFSVSLSDGVYQKLQKIKKARPHLSMNAIIVEALLAMLGGGK